MSTQFHCALCNAELPEGVRVAFFADQDSEEPFLGDFCSVAHAFVALEQISTTHEMPDTIFLGVRVDRSGHDEDALASVMAEIARRAVRAALATDEATADTVPPPPPGDLN
jgi:hypothetical protein